MKTFNFGAVFLRPIRSLGMCLCVLFVNLLAPTSPAAEPVSPVGTTWDCIMSGPREGIAYLEFFDDFTFVAYEFLVPKASAGNTSGVGGSRNYGGSPRDNGGGGSTNVSAHQIFGGNVQTGPWNYDNKGRVIGFFTEIANTCTTNTPVAIATNDVCVGENTFTLTNLVGEIVCYTNGRVCTPTLTNAVVFTARVVEGRRLTFVLTTPSGKVTYRGVPAIELPDVSGNWYATKKQGGHSYTEFFTLENQFLPEIPNLYNVVGAGPGYSYSGIATISSQKKVAFWTHNDGQTEVIRALFGSFNARKVSLKAHGWDQPAGPLGDRVQFDAALKLFP